MLNPFHRGLAKWRARKITAEARSLYYGAVHNCRMMSTFNKDFAFIVKRKGVFGGPVIEQIPRPGNVQLSELDNCVVIKDGKVYELRQEEV